jgi:hypothetical protein
MAEKEACPKGNEITSVDRCREAEKWKLSLGLDPQRSFQTDSFFGLPFQCAAQVNADDFGDDTFHFNTDEQTDNSRFTSGEFLMICEKGG